MWYFPQIEQLFVELPLPEGTDELPPDGALAPDVELPPEVAFVHMLEDPPEEPEAPPLGGIEEPEPPVVVDGVDAGV